MNEVFASAMEHGETEQQIIQRLGTPKNLQTAPQNSLALITPIEKRERISFLLLLRLLSRLLPFRYMLLHNQENVPEGAIGQADATTNIQIEGAFAFDISQILWLLGCSNSYCSLLIIRTIHKNRR